MDKNRTIHDAVRDGNIDEIKLFIARGTDINSKDKMFRTPLHLAAWKGNKDIIHLLLIAKANSTITAMDHFLPLHFAAQGGFAECVKLLVKKNKSTINSRISKGQKAAIHLAAIKNHYDTIKVLCELGADINAKTSNGKTASELTTSNEIKQFLQSFQANNKKSDNSKSNDSNDNIVPDSDIEPIEETTEDINQANKRKYDEIENTNEFETKDNDKIANKNNKSKIKLSHLEDDDINE